jgi:hypothetical protein
MKTVVLAGTLAALLALAAPALADHTRGPAAPAPEPGGAPAESSLDIDLKVGPHGFRLGGRLFGRDGYLGGAWLTGEARRDGFSVEGRVEHDGRAHDFRFDAGVDEWARRALRRGLTDL